MKDRKMSFYNRIVKRMLDIICSLAAIVCLSVLYLPICAIIKCTSEGPVFFRQKRIGKNKKYFNILKFRTMRIDTPKDCPTHLLKNPEQYITKVGAFLRKTSLDELPQIFNIFKGDMSVIGPRPALWNQDDLISERDEYGINDLKPGLTGWAQINGRDDLRGKTGCQDRTGSPYDCQVFRAYRRPCGKYCRMGGIFYHRSAQE